MNRYPSESLSCSVENLACFSGPPLMKEQKEALWEVVLICLTLWAEHFLCFCWTGGCNGVMAWARCLVMSLSPRWSVPDMKCPGPLCCCWCGSSGLSKGPMSSVLFHPNLAWRWINSAAASRRMLGFSGENRIRNDVETCLTGAGGRRGEKGEKVIKNVLLNRFSLIGLIR